MADKSWKRKVWNRDNWLCCYCRCQLQLKDNDRPDAATVDHKIPVSRGGTNDMANLASACRECNEGKGNMTLAEWERAGKPKKPYVDRGSAARYLARGYL
jgi:5-methylcytosine-specific restriction endonuclease McrA